MKNHKRGCRFLYVKNTLNQQVTDVFFIVYLLKIITNIIKANTIIVSTTNANKSKYIISNKTASIIAPPPHSRHKPWIKSGNHICFFSFPMLDTIQHFLQKSNNF